MRNKKVSPAYLLEGFTLLTHRDIRPFVIYPLLLNLLLFLALGFYLVDSFSSLVERMMVYVPEWLSFLSWLLWLLFGGLLLIVYGYSFALVGNLLASPFYGLLAERVENLVYGKAQIEPFSWRAVIAVAGRSIARELLKLLYFLPRIAGVLLACAILSFIPLLNMLAPLIAFAWGSWSLSLQYLDYPADNQQLSFSDLRRQTRQRKLTAMGFGGVVLAATTIPLLNMLAIPASVIGATLLWNDQLVDPTRQESLCQQ